MGFGATWQELLKSLREHPPYKTLATPVSGEIFRVVEVEDDFILIKYLDRNRPVSLQREKFETLYLNVTDSREGFDLDRLPPNTEPYATVLSLHSRIDFDKQEWRLTETDASLASPVVETKPSEDSETQRDKQGQPSVDETSRTEPTVAEMLDNMGDPPDEIVCPIEGCQYSHRSASSVARHVSGSSTAKHIWANTDYAGWRDFVRKHGESPG